MKKTTKPQTKPPVDREAVEPPPVAVGFIVWLGVTPSPLSKVFISENLTHKSDAHLMAEQATQHDYVNVEGLHRIDRPTAGCEHFVGETLMQALRSVYSSCRIAVIAAFCSESRPIRWTATRQPIPRGQEYMATHNFRIATPST